MESIIVRSFNRHGGALGNPNDEEKFGAIVISAELIGSVGIQEIEKQQSEIEGGKK